MRYDIGYKALRMIIEPVFDRLYSVERIGDLVKAPAIIASNHISHLDPFFIIKAIDEKEPVHFVAAPQKKYNWFYYLSNQIVLGKGGFKEYYKKAEQVLSSKRRYLGIFPEGKVSRDGEIHYFRDGASSIAIRTGVAIVPTYIEGAYDEGRNFPRPFRDVKVHFGDVIYPDEKRKDKAYKKEISLELERRVKELKNNS